ncbi:MAG: efflux RND transporter periplasmic adaptor subunit [Desulfarculaceae bacterium]|nr:efflux RND transporter periplasmic adaptor subunit [Desulfarculaceae bacterium]MCF8071140.1 efflux RND transporter periplasmic adaptor subunit [Desulfarculaceae bacterium]MCF8101257.1 efflux RND transporter periplasmic adaptor subunit [Desulfarculaceae bacterium]MCF8115194.1 efflux RND transporter periplasmic adaptor subunit [Desulfarculaceae bacterium]
MLAKKPLLACVLMAAAAVMALGAAGCGKEEKKAQVAAKKATPVTLGKAAARRVVYTLDQVGTLVSPKMVTLRAELAAPVTEILFKEGKAVKQGQILVKQDTAKLKATARNLQQRIHQLKIRLAHQKRILERNKPLVKDNLVSKLKYDDLETEIKVSDATLSQAQADLARHHDLMEDADIRAPFDGVAGSRNISVGDFLKVGDKILTVVSLDPLEISFMMPERYKAGITVDQGADLMVAAYPGRTFKAQIYFISPVVDVATRSFKVKARVDNSQRLLNPGMFARVHVVTQVKEQALTVPWAGVIQTETETYVYLNDKGKAKKVSVKLGKVTSQWAEVITDQIEPGAEVILEGKFQVRPGSEVSTKQEAPKAPADKK